MVAQLARHGERPHTQLAHVAEGHRKAGSGVDGKDGVDSAGLSVRFRHERLICSSRHRMAARFGRAQ
jgi:hypothetical protein